MLSLFSWDTVSVIPVAVLNEALGKNSSQILSSFNFSVAGNPFTSPATCSGTFGPWSVAQGPNTDFLALSLPVSSGNISAGTDSIDIAGLTALMQVSLSFVADSVSGNSCLTFSFLNAGVMGNAPAPDVVTPGGLLGPDAVLSALGLAGQTMLLNGFAAMIVKDAKPLNFCLAELNFAQPDTNTWLSPGPSAYLYLSQPEGTDYFAILSVSAGLPDTSLTPQVDAGILPAAGSDNNASFAFTGNLFLANVIMPALPAAFGGNLTSQQLQFDATNGQITISEPFDLNSVKEGAIRYYPKVTSLTVENTIQGIGISLSGECNMKAGINMTFSFQANPSLNMDVTSQQLTFTPDPRPSFQHHVDIPWWWAGGGPIVEAVVQLIVAEIESGIAGKLQHALGQGTASYLQPNIAWTGINSFAADAVTLNGALALNGTVLPIV